MIRRIIRKLITFSGLNPKPVNITAKISLTYPSEKLRHKKIVITGDVVPAHYDEFGILTVNIYDFLMDPTCIEK